MPLLQLNEHTRYSIGNLFNCAARCSGSLGRYRPDLRGMNAGKSPLHCAASLETRRS